MRLPILPIAQRFRSLFASCNRQSKIYNLRFLAGVLAQLVERLNGIEEVTGSNPVGSTFILMEFRFGNRRVTFPATIFLFSENGFSTKDSMFPNRAPSVDCAI